MTHKSIPGPRWRIVSSQAPTQEKPGFICFQSRWMVGIALFFPPSSPPSQQTNKFKKHWISQRRITAGLPAWPAYLKIISHFQWGANWVCISIHCCSSRFLWETRVHSCSSSCCSSGIIPVNIPRKGALHVLMQCRKIKAHSHSILLKAEHLWQPSSRINQIWFSEMHPEFSCELAADNSLPY